ncbi:DUF4367 domain-containing protein [Halalkalibacter urbisdiaboli]|uniref:DUF4367 domain-containing protein n=1 Tax=Halalkalibacter urbisdiaboli TaxID=1960589 RepID=UPI0013FD277F|nr:DUF4367 domain-containing protein [Halalkalibacter urbisdiaboli]
MRRYVILLMVLTILVLSSCGTEQLNQSTVLSKSIEAVNELDSYSVDMDMDVNMMEMDMNMKMTGDVTHEPDAMHMFMNMGMPGMSMDFEAYLLEDEVYVSMFGEWLKMDANEMGLEDFDQLNEEEMKKLLEFSDEFTMNEEDGVYVLTLSGEGDEYSVLIEDYIKSGMGDFYEDAEMEEMLETIKINDFDFQIHIDKKTFMQTTQIFNADVEIVEGDFPMSMTLGGTLTISNVNGVDPIEIPEEVKEHAVEEDAFYSDFDEDLLGSYEEMTLEEIQHVVDYTVPEIHALPDGYTLTESKFDETMDMIMLNYEKGIDNHFMVTIFPTDGEPFLEYELVDGEEVTVQGTKGVLYEMDDFISLSWEQHGLYFEIAGGGVDITTDTVMNIAESIK